MPAIATAAILLFWGAALACVVAEAAILRAVLVRRPGRSAMEIVWAVLPAVALGVLLAYTWHVVRGGGVAP
jgi:heme/copper-type cytochrome/quinol oxidase subunit 2